MYIVNINFFPKENLIFQLIKKNGDDNIKYST